MNKKDNVDRKEEATRRAMKSASASATTQIEKGAQDLIHDQSAKKLAKEPRIVITPFPDKKP